MFFAKVYSNLVREIGLECSTLSKYYLINDVNSGNAIMIKIVKVVVVSWKRLNN